MPVTLCHPLLWSNIHCIQMTSAVCFLLMYLFLLCELYLHGFQVEGSGFCVVYGLTALIDISLSR